MDGIRLWSNSERPSMSHQGTGGTAVSNGEPVVFKGEGPNCSHILTEEVFSFTYKVLFKFDLVANF